MACSEGLYSEGQERRGREKACVAEWWRLSTRLEGFPEAGCVGPCEPRHTPVYHRQTLVFRDPYTSCTGWRTESRHRNRQKSERPAVCPEERAWGCVS